MTAQNALFAHDLTGKRVLVLVPHADDEVNAAGGDFAGVCGDGR